MENNYVIVNGELYHHGVKGMKWGVRKDKTSNGSTTKTAGKKKAGSGRSWLFGKKKTKKSQVESTSPKPPKKKTINELSDDELRQRINRLQMEKQLKDLMAAENAKQKSKGKAFVMDVIEKSGKNIATQLVTYALGKGVNAAFKDVFNDPAIVNPKKGQKDK